MPNCYVYCRFLPNFTDQFPFEKVSNIPGRRLGDEIVQLLESELRTRTDTGGWESFARKCIAKKAAGEQAGYAIRLKQYERAGCGAPPTPPADLLSKAIPTIQNLQPLGYVLAFLGWTDNEFWEPWPCGQSSFIVAKTDSLDEADVIAAALRQSPYRHIPGTIHRRYQDVLNPKFGSIDGGKLARPDQLLCEDDYDQVMERVPRLEEFYEHWYDTQTNELTHTVTTQISEALEYAILASRLVAKLRGESNKAEDPNKENVESCDTGGTQSVDRRESNGWVTNPSDPTAYVPASTITRDFPGAAPTMRRLHKLIDTNPKIRKWQREENRLSIHLADFKTECDAVPSKWQPPLSSVANAPMWRCAGCSEEYADSATPSRCKKCGQNSFEPVMTRRMPLAPGSGK